MARPLVEQLQFLLHRQGGMKCAGGITLSGLRQPEQGHETVTGVLVDLPSPGMNYGVQHIPHSVNG